VKKSFKHRAFIRIWLKSSATLLLVTGIGRLIDYALRKEGMPRRDLLFLSDLLVGVVAAVLVAVMAIRQEQKGRFLQVRLRIIREMNHHIRNALQVISFQAHLKGETQIQEIDAAVKRITWALSDILPRMPSPHGHITQRDVRMPGNHGSKSFEEGVFAEPEVTKFTSHGDAGLE